MPASEKLGAVQSLKSFASTADSSTSRKSLLFKNLAVCIENLHAKGVFHFNIDLTNIWVEDQFYVYLGPFKNTRYIQTKHLAFCPPEFVIADIDAPEGLEFKADIWALGLAFCCLKFGAKFCREALLVESGDEYIYFLESLLGFCADKPLSFLSSQSVARVKQLLNSKRKQASALDLQYLAECGFQLRKNPAAFSLLSLEPAQRPSAKEALGHDAFREQPSSLAATAKREGSLQATSSFTDQLDVSSAENSRGFTSNPLARPDRLYQRQRTEGQAAELTHQIREVQRFDTEPAQSSSWRHHRRNSAQQEKPALHDLRPSRAEEPSLEDRDSNEPGKRARSPLVSREASAGISAKERIKRPFYNSRNQYLVDAEKPPLYRPAAPQKSEHSFQEELQAPAPKPRPLEPADPGPAAEPKSASRHFESIPRSQPASNAMTPSKAKRDPSVEAGSVLGEPTLQGPWELQLLIRLSATRFVTSFEGHYPTVSGVLLFKKSADDEGLKSEFACLSYRDHLKTNLELSVCLKVQRVEEVDDCRAEITLYGHKASQNFKRYIASGSLEVRPVILACLMSKDGSREEENRWVALRNSQRANNVVVQVHLSAETKEEKPGIRGDSLEQTRHRPSPARNSEFSPFGKQKPADMSGVIQNSRPDFSIPTNAEERSLRRNQHRPEEERESSELGRPTPRYPSLPEDRPRPYRGSVDARPPSRAEQPPTIKASFSFGKITSKGSREEQDSLRNEIHKLQFDLGGRDDPKRDPQLSRNYERALRDLKSILSSE